VGTLVPAVFTLRTAKEAGRSLAGPRAAWRDINAAADSKRGLFVRALTRAAERGRAALDVAALEDAYLQRSQTRMEFVLGYCVGAMEDQLRLDYHDAITATMAAGGQAAARHARNRGGFRVNATAPSLPPILFDLVNPRAVRWASERSSTLITRVSAGTRAAIRRIIAESFSRGIPTAEIARRIRPLIGLTPGSATAVQDFIAAMRANPGRKMWAGKMAVRVPKGGADAEFLRRRGEQYARRLLNLRATTIARTETIAAANEGQRQLWLQAVGRGWLRGDENREWIATPDDRTCPECEDLNGEVAPLDAPFSSGEMSPPAHPSCRCATGLTREKPWH
jgi:SPP1 gp7 family putative phage head morphogenesis protein